MLEKIEICPACSSRQLQNLYVCADHLVSKEKFTISKCLSCQLLITTPRPDSQNIAKYYDSDAYLSHSSSSSGIGKLYKLAQTYTLWTKHRLLKNLKPAKKRLLDYGSGSGTFLQYVTQRGWDAAGVEPNEKARIASQNKTLTVYPDLPTAKQQEAHFEVITLWHVLEHVHNIDITLEYLASLLSPQGFLVVAVPNTASWDAVHYKQHWAAFDVPRHLYHFNAKNIADLLKKHNFAILTKKPMYLDSFYISLLSERHQTGQTNFVKSLINGCKSNIYGINSGEFSSMIYIFRKK